MRILRRAIRWSLRKAGYDVIPFDPEMDFNDFDLRQEDEELGILSRVGPFTMTSRSRVSALCHAVDYVVAHGIPGDIVECGVWKGGSMMAVALRLLQLGVRDRDLYLYDTYEGMTRPSSCDTDYRDRPAGVHWQAQAPQGGGGAWLKVTLSDVRRNMESTGYPAQHIHYIAGPVEQTLSEAVPAKISILRLDTDWYESTRCELENLYANLSVGGVLILDDYGFWKGQRKAMDDFIAQYKLRLFLTRVDCSCRIAVKLDPS